MANALLNHWILKIIELVNVPISSKLKYVTVETTWENTRLGRWEDNITMDLKEIVDNVINRLDTAQIRIIL